jgi:hypothetical protein
LKNLIPYFFLLTIGNVFSQDLYLNYPKQPINEILIDLSAKYNVQVSINSSSSNSCEISLNDTFPSIDKVFDFIAESCNLHYQKVGEVYSFKPLEIKVSEQKKYNFLYQGIVLDQISLEPLPFAKLKLKERNLVCDENGFFSFYSDLKELQLSCRYLGFYTLDTLISLGSKIELQLQFELNDMETVQISHQKARDISFQSVGDQSGLYKFNNIASNLIPSNNDMIFNLLRLYPGVNASSELSSEAIIWGSYPGQSSTIFDGITLFNSTGTNENVSRINPFMVKNIELYKGGYNADIGDRIGSVTLIDGKDGNKDSSSMVFGINNQIANVYYNQPLKKINSSFQFGIRRSYFQFLNGLKLKNNDAYSEYNYQDINLKWNTNFKNKDRLEISLLNSSDDNTTFLDKRLENDYYSNLNINAKQYGGSITYNKVWNRGGMTKFQSSFSQFIPNFSNEVKVIENKDSLNADYYLENTISEKSLKIEHQFPVRKQFDFLFGTGLVQNNSSYIFKNNQELISDASALSSARISSFVKNRFHIKDIISLTTGLKMDYSLINSTAYFQPRVQAKIKLFTSFHMNAAWGIYNQFISKTAVKDEFGNQPYFWEALNQTNVNVPTSIHKQVSFVYSKSAIEILVEGYFKEASNLKSYSTNKENDFQEIKGNSSALGLDFFVKKRFSKHQFLIAYSIGKVQDDIFAANSTIEILAPQNQFQELKAGLFFKFNKWKFSFTEVIGSGFQEANKSSNSPYSRLDFACNYKVLDKKWNVDLGLSILNVFNAENTRFNQFSVLPGDTAHLSATPFTPTLNLIISLR